MTSKQWLWILWPIVLTVLSLSVFGPASKSSPLQLSALLGFCALACLRQGMRLWQNGARRTAMAVFCAAGLGMSAVFILIFRLTRGL
jgi:hypothetical protein